MLARLTAVTLTAVCLAASGCTAATTRAPAPTAPGVTALRGEVLATVPHDPAAFTQGLELVDGVLYEGTGLDGKSEMRTVDPATGAVTRHVALPADFFGEGVTVLDDRIWQITWQNGVAIERDRTTLAERRRVTYPGEGWGLCHADGRLVMSDGSDKLTFRDPDSFAATGEVHVREGGNPVTELNELECAGGAVYANVWQTDRIVRIDPTTGAVTASIDLSGLLRPDEREHTDVLNGIAAIPGTDEFLVTGKLWPTMFRIRFVPAA
ncbi:glutaminyl-peptide cyclotransferase [Actinokineospora enzanensis]|uniref:glutaminyl-peptide cyclotransferase n=1 Tax=Actinokineospora enzanensis TaxID=155975 RepID=UPI00039E34A1|nr:glutaminyl-peptide cyclotransferase [Actinokineospora enzanensis]